MKYTYMYEMHGSQNDKRFELFRLPKAAHILMYNTTAKIEMEKMV